MKNILLTLTALGILVSGCKTDNNKMENNTVEKSEIKTKIPERGAEEYLSEDFADIRMHRYYVNGWDQLTKEQKELLYYLYNAALAGRDILWDQNYKHNLKVRKTLENIVKTYSGDKSDSNWIEFETYVKRVFVSNGIHHHYSMNKLKPGFDFNYFLKSADVFKN